MQSKFATKYVSPNYRPISIVIPCRNETRGTLLRAVKKLEMMNEYLLDIVIVENGSDNLDGIPNTRYYFVEQGGLGLALKIGLMKAGEQRIFFLPADMSYDLSFVDIAIELNGNADMVIASKFMKGSSVERPLMRTIYSRLYELKNRYLDGIPLHDITGAKMFKKDKVLPLLNECSSTGIGFEVQLIKAMLKHKMKIVEVPAIVHDYGKAGVFRWMH